MSSFIPPEVLLRVASHLDCESQYALLRAIPPLASELTYCDHLLSETAANGNDLVHILAKKGELAMLQSIFPEKDLARSRTPGNTIPRLKQMLLTRNKNDEGCTPLHLAAGNGNKAVVEWILNRPDVDLSLNSGDKDNYTCVDWAAMRGHTEIVSLLLDNPKLTVDWNGVERPNPLCVAIEYGQEETAKMIIKHYGHRISINAQTTFGVTALTASVLHRRQAITELLVKHKETNVKVEDYLGNTPLHLAVRNKNRAAIQTLLAHPDTDPNAVDWYGHTPLQEAICAADEPTTRLLLKHPDTDINLGHGTKACPLIKAVQVDHLDIVKLLVAHPAIELNKPDFWGMTALSWAAFACHIDIAEFLLAQPDIDPNTTDEDGLTPLCHAMQIGCEEIAELLCQRSDVEIDHKDSFGWTALAHAQHAPQDQEQLLALLTRHQAIMTLHPEMMIIYHGMEHSDLALDVVASMIAGHDIRAYMEGRFGKERTDEAFATGENAVKVLLFRNTRAAAMRREWTDSYFNPPM